MGKEIEEDLENEERWDNRDLGADEEFVKRASPEREKKINDSLGLHAISIRLQTETIELLKEFAREDGIGYQPLLRQVITKYANERAIKKEMYAAGESIKDFIENLSFGEYVCYLRKADDLTQQELAEKIGCKKQFIIDVENGREKVGLDFAKRVAEAMGYSIAPFAIILINEQLKMYDPTLRVEIIKKKCMNARDALRDVIENTRFGEFVKSIRECDEISQSELAKRMQVSLQFLNEIELGKSNVSIEFAKKIAEKLGYPHEAFVEILTNDLLKKIEIYKTLDATAWANEKFKNLKFGEFVKNIREADGVSQSELAKRIGVTRQYLNAVELDKTPINIDLVVDIAKALGYPEFLFLEVCLNDLFRRKGVLCRVKLVHDDNS